MSGGEGAGARRAPRAGASQGPEPEILSSLPRRRPGRRSPRRDEARARATRQAPRRPAPRRDPAAEPEPGAVEELVRTGVSVATGSVAVGARLAGQALGALRGVVERR